MSIGHKIGHFGNVLQANLLAWYGKTKPNTTKACIKIKRNVLQHKINKKLKPGLVASYDIRPGNGEGLFWFRHFINLSLTYLLRHLPHKAEPLEKTGASHMLFIGQMPILSSDRVKAVKRNQNTDHNHRKSPTNATSMTEFSSVLLPTPTPSPYCDVNTIPSARARISNCNVKQKVKLTTQKKCS